MHHSGRIQPFRPQLLLLLALSIPLVLSTGCLSRTTTVAGPPVIAYTATLDELLDKLRVFGEIKTMRSTVVMRIAVMSDDFKKRTEYTDVRGFVITRRPGWIHAQANFLGQKAFDMVCDGATFRVYIPLKKRFFVGDNDRDEPSEKRLENIRPQHIFEAMMIDPPGDDEYAMLENIVEGPAAYHVVVLARNGGPNLRISRKAWFERAGMQLARIQVFNENSDVATDVRYLDWEEQNSLPYAKTVIITRPKDGYSLTVRTTKPGLNAQLPPDAFELKAPEGVKVEWIGGEKTAGAEQARR